MVVFRHCLLLAASFGSIAASEDSGLRGSFLDRQAGQYECTISGASGQDACDVSIDVLTVNFWCARECFILASIVLSFVESCAHH